LSVVPAFMGFKSKKATKKDNGMDSDAVEDHKDKFEDYWVLIKSEFTLWRN